MSIYPKTIIARCLILRRKRYVDLKRRKVKNKKWNIYQKQSIVIIRTLHIESITRGSAFTNDVGCLTRIQTSIVSLDRLEMQLGAPHAVIQLCRSALYQQRRRRRCPGIGQRRVERHRVFEPLDACNRISVCQALETQEVCRIFWSDRKRLRIRLESHFR